MSITEYTNASKRLIEKALGNGDAQMLIDVKLLMDTVSELQSHSISVSGNLDDLWLCKCNYQNKGLICTHCGELRSNQ